MAAEREVIERAIAVVSEWTADRPAAELQIALSELEPLDRARNAQQWVELKAAIATKKLPEPVKALVSDRRKASRGYWWWVAWS